MAGGVTDLIRVLADTLPANYGVSEAGECVRVQRRDGSRSRAVFMMARPLAESPDPAADVLAEFSAIDKEAHRGDL